VFNPSFLDTIMG